MYALVSVLTFAEKARTMLLITARLSSLQVRSTQCEPARTISAGLRTASEQK